MKRLTGRAPDGTAYLYNMGGTNAAIDRLAAYEDAGMEVEKMTNADIIRQMTDEELSNLLSTVQSSIALNMVNALQPYLGKAYYDNAIKQVRDRATQNQRKWLDWLRQEVTPPEKTDDEINKILKKL